jgi:hypothetical protein
MDEAMTGSVETDVHLTGRWQSLVSIISLRQETFLYITRKDQPCN